MRIPQVAIVGRPNVGKSSIFNWLARKRLAIVDDMAGVTRDRMTFIIDEDDHLFELVDTGGMGIEDTDDLTEQIEGQITVGIEMADVLVFVVDTRSGVVPLDQHVAQRLRAVDKPIIFVANKADSDNLDPQANDFFQLGFGEPICCSTTANRNRQQLLDAIIESLPEVSEETDMDDPEMKVAIVGRRNVGKSTFVNAVAEADRMIVSEVPGTTRDSVDVRFEMDGKAFVAIDTPGLRRNVSIRTNIDYYGTHRAKRSIRRADVTLMFFDAEQPISKVDKQLVSYITEEYKPCIFVVNKWDLYHGQVATEEWAQYLRDTFPNMWHVPIAFITAQTGKNVKMLLNHAQMLFKQSRERVSTAQLNKLVKAAMTHHPPPLVNNHRPKVYFATQAAVQPPTIVLMCNDPRWFTPSYKQYLLGVFRDKLTFGEIPIRLLIRKRESSEPTADLSRMELD